MNKDDVRQTINDVSKDIIQRDFEEKVIYTLASMLAATALVIEQTNGINEEEAKELVKKVTNEKEVSSKLTKLALDLLTSYKHISEASSSDMIDIVDSTLGINSGNRMDS